MTYDPERLLRILQEANPWWESGAVPSNLCPPYRRRDFFVLREKLSTRQILALTGPRQVGKTTLVYQLIQDLLGKGTDSRRILFVSFDLPGLERYSEEPLEDALRVYEERVLEESYREMTAPIYLFLDEVTNLSGWDRKLKGWFDLGYDIRIATTSSSHIELSRGLGQSLVGRATIQLLLSWKFVDVMSIRTTNEKLNDGFLGARDTLRSALRTGRLEPLYDELRRLQPHSTGERIRLKRAVDWYLLTDGYPELVQSEDLGTCLRRLKEYLDLTLIHDVYRFYDIRASTKVFEDLLGLMASQSGGLVSYRKTAETLGLRERTLRSYLDYLEGAFLISTSQFYSKSKAARARKQRKVYLGNTGLLNLLRGRLDRTVLSDAAEAGVIAEAAVHADSKRLAFNLGSGLSPVVSYWRDKSGHEVDCVIEVDRRPLPIEVKYKNNPTSGLDGIQAFIEEKEVSLGLVVTKDKLDLQPPLLFLPIQDFLMLT